MDFIQYVQQKTKPYPLLYKLLVLVYAPYGEVSFFIHAIYTGKLFAKLRRSRFSEIVSKQKILEFSIGHDHFETVDAFRQWLNRERIRYLEGGWTFFIPPQKGLSRHFDFLSSYYPTDSGLKILKDFRHPEKARYTFHKQHPAPGAALKRWLTPSPVALLRVANYLYMHGIGVRIYDILALKTGKHYLTCYVVQQVEGPEVEQKDYDAFMRTLKSLLEKGELTTIHESLDIMYDFEPPNCSDNLIMDGMEGKALFVDFQGFLFKNEEGMMEKIFSEVREKVHLGDARFSGEARRYPNESIPDLSMEKHALGTRWQQFLEMMEISGCSFRERVIYDIGCNTGSMLYNALSEGAQWGIGWDNPEVVGFANQVLLGLGATRFDLFGEVIQADTDFISKVPERYRKKKDSILFYLGVEYRIGFPNGVSELPWEYMFYEGHADQNYATSLDRLQNIPWLRNTEVLSYRSFSDRDSREKVVILLRRQD